MMEAIRNWLLTCPLIEHFGGFSVNFLAAEPLAFSIEETPHIPVVKRYLDGSTLREKEWVLAAAQDYSPDALQQIANSGFWEQFTGWVEQQNKKKNFPQMPPGQTARAVEVTSTHYLYQVDANTGRYQVQMKLTYYQKGER